MSYKDVVISFSKDIPKNLYVDTYVNNSINYEDDDIIMEDPVNIRTNSNTSNYSYNDDFTKNTFDNYCLNNNIMESIIEYIKSIKKDNCPIIIIDGENLIVGPQQFRTSKVNRIFSRFLDKNKIVILVVKKSGGTRRFKNYTGVDVPEHFIFVSLHADNKTCPDDGFILELAKKIDDSIVITDDEYINREHFNYGDLNIGTKLTTNIGIQGRYIPDIESINESKIRRQYITRKN